LDLVLAMVERDTDSELARTIAKTMVIHHRCDSALVASSCSTSQCSPKTPSANHGEQFSLSRMAGMRSRSYKVFDNSTIRRGSAAITKSPSLNSEKCVSAFGLTLSGAAQSMHTSLSRSTPSQSRIMGPGRNIVEPRVIQRMGS